MSLRKYSIGVDLGGTNLRVAAYDGGCDFLDTIVLPTRLNAGRDQVVHDMCGAIRALKSRDFGGRVLQGIEAETPGPHKLPAGILRNLPNFPGWDGFNLRSAIATGLGCDIVLENDANLAAFAEQRLGAGSSFGVADLCVITLSKGGGNGLVLNGKVWDGVNGMTGGSRPHGR